MERNARRDAVRRNAHAISNRGTGFFRDVTKAGPKRTTLPTYCIQLFFLPFGALNLVSLLSFLRSRDADGTKKEFLVQLLDVKCVSARSRQRQRNYLASKAPEGNSYQDAE